MPVPVNLPRGEKGISRADERRHRLRERDGEMKMVSEGDLTCFHMHSVRSVIFNRFEHQKNEQIKTGKRQRRRRRREGTPLLTECASRAGSRTARSSHRIEFRSFDLLASVRASEMLENSIDFLLLAPLSLSLSLSLLLERRGGKQIPTLVTPAISLARAH